MTGRVVAKIAAPASSTTDRMYEGSHMPILAAILHARNPLQILTASEDGFIRVWDYADSSLLDAIDTDMSVYQMCAHKGLGEQILVAGSKHKPTRRQCSLFM